LLFSCLCKRFSAAAFADAGLAAQREDLPPPAEHLVERAFEETELLVAPDESRIGAVEGARGIL
jgi:hypothetical protein